MTTQWPSLAGSQEPAGSPRDSAPRQGPWCCLGARERPGSTSTEGLAKSSREHLDWSPPHSPGLFCGSQHVPSLERHGSERVLAMGGCGQEGKLLLD